MVAKIALTSMFVKLQKLGTDWHALCYCVRLLLVCLASYSGFLAIAFAACGTRRLVCATDGKRWGEKAGYEANSFRVSRHGGSVASGW